jgi:phosphate transport system substrate-binding protein
MVRVPAFRGLILLPAVLFFGAASACAEPVTVSGTGSAMTAVRLLAAEYMKRFPGDHVEVLPGIGTTGSVKAVLAGRLDIGVGGRPLRDAERRAGAVETPLARSLLGFCGHHDVPVDTLSLREVIDICEGRKTAWPAGTPVRPVLRPEGETDVDILRGISREMHGALDRAMRRPGMIVAPSDRDTADTIENSPGAFGALALGMVVAEKRNVKVISLDGGARFLEKRFSLITVRDPSPAARRFLEFSRSREAASLLEQLEFIPQR